MMRNAACASKAKFILLACGLALGTLQPASVFAQSISTWKGGTGVWSDAAKWQGGIPNSAAAEAHVDGGNSATSNVTVDGDYTVGSLILTDPVSLADGKSLTIDSSGFAGAGIVDGTSLSLLSHGLQTSLVVKGNVTIQNSLFTDSEQTSGLNVLTGTAGSTVDLQSSFIFGLRRIGDGMLNIISEGSIYGGALSGGETVIQPLATFVQKASGNLAIGQGSIRLTGNGSFTLDGHVSISNNGSQSGSATVTKDTSATLTNFDATSRTLNGGSYFLYGLSGEATLTLNLGPILINNAEIEMVTAQTTFDGLESLTTNRKTLQLNSRDFSTAGAFENSGSLAVAFCTFTANGLLTNSGTIALDTSSSGDVGTLQLAQGYTQTDGALRLGGTSASGIDTPVDSPNAPLVIQGGRLEGGGTVNASINNSAVLAPFTRYQQFSKLTVNGSLTEASTATLEFRSGGADSFNRTSDSVAVSGSVALGGALQLYLGELAKPPASTASFTLLSASSLSGTFSNVASGARLRTVDGAGSYLVSYGAGASNPNAITISDFQPTPPRVLGAVPAGEPAGTVFASFGPPTTGPISGSIKVGKTKIPVIFAGDGSVRVRVGDETPIPGATFAKLGIPSGDAALVRVKGPSDSVMPGTTSVLLAGLTEGPVRIAARQGVGLTDQPDLAVKKFGTIDGNGSVIFFTATLQGTGVTAANDAALFAALADGTVRILAREGSPLVPGGPAVSLISTLVGVAGTLPEGRWRAGDDAITARLTFADKSQALYFLNAPTGSAGTKFRVVGVGDTLGAPLAGAKVATIGLSGYPAVRLTLVPGIGGVTKADAAVIVRFGGESIDLVARQNGIAPGLADTVKFKTLGEPISGANGSAFAATLAGTVSGASLWLTVGSGDPFLLARVGGFAPGGGTFASFSALAFPDGLNEGSIFTGKIKPGSQNGITAKNNFGLWAANKSGVVSLLLRPGQSVVVGGKSRTVKSFQALLPAKGSLGAAHGYDNAGRVTVLATVFDPATPKVTSVALVDLQLP